VPKDDLRRRGGPALKRDRPSASASPTLEAASKAQTEIDVRGKRFVEAEPLVDRWIDDAIMLGHSPLRLIHGKGTGLLGKGLQEFLKAHPFVQNVRYGNADEGGGGVTVFELRSPTA
jgi:DNA mismatch repair protein MutS2